MPRIQIKDLDNTEKGKGADMGLYFNSTFVKVSIDGKVVPVWAKYSGCSGGVHHFHTATGTVLSTESKFTDAFIEWNFPTGWHNTKKSAIFAQRVPKRQYLKGICAGNMAFTSAESLAKELVETKDEKIVEVMKVLHGKVTHSAQGFQELFEPTPYPSLEEAYILLKSKKMFARALSKEFAIIPHPVSKDFLVLCHDLPIGELLTKNKLKLLLPNFKAECLSFFQKEGTSEVSPS